MFSALRLRGVLAAFVLIACAQASYGQDSSGPCAAAETTWAAEAIEPCIDQLTKQIDQASSNKDKAALLSKRALFYVRLGYAERAKGEERLQAAWEAALADYTAAIALDPLNPSFREKRTRLLLDMKRGGEALKDAETLVEQTPQNVRYHTLRGTALASLNRHKEAIEVFTHAIGLAQSCAEGAVIQNQINEYRHAFDPPLTREQIEQLMKNPPPLYDKPEAGVRKLGFRCTPIPPNTFEELVSAKEWLFALRGESHLALGDPYSALRDHKYSVAISPVRELGSVRLCEIEIDLNDGWDAQRDCRYAFDFNSWVVLNDPSSAAKIGLFLLEDGDLKGACRIAFPFVTEGMESYINNPNIKALQKRVKGGLEGASLKSCEAEYRW